MYFSYASTSENNYCISLTANIKADNVELLVPGIRTVIEKVVDYYLPMKLNENDISIEKAESTEVEILPWVFNGYKIIKPVTFQIEYLSDTEYLASFNEAGISFSGSTPSEAINELKIEIIEVYKLYKSEILLGSWPKQQLAVLEKYIGQKKVQSFKGSRSRNHS